MADKNGFLLRIITPDRVFYENQVDMVEFNTTEGEVGILPGHIPMTVIVKPGVLCIGEPEGEKLAALHAGFAEILPEGVTILRRSSNGPARSTRAGRLPQRNVRRGVFRTRLRTRTLQGRRPLCREPLCAFRR